MASKRHGVFFTESDIQDIDNILAEIETRVDFEEIASQYEHGLEKESEHILGDGEVEQEIEMIQNEPKHQNTEVEMNEEAKKLKNMAELLFTRINEGQTMKNKKSDNASNELVVETSCSLKQGSCDIELIDHVKDIGRSTESSDLTTKSNSATEMETTEQGAKLRNAQVVVTSMRSKINEVLRAQSTDQNVSEGFLSMVLMAMKKLNIDTEDERQFEKFLHAIRKSIEIKTKEINNKVQLNQDEDNLNHLTLDTNQSDSSYGARDSVC